MVDFDAVCQVPNARSRGRIIGVGYDDHSMAAIDQFLVLGQYPELTGRSTMMHRRMKSMNVKGECAYRRQLINVTFYTARLRVEKVRDHPRR